MSIQIRFVSYQYKRWIRAIEKIKVIALSEEDNLPRKMSIEYIDEIRKNISAGRYSTTYVRYNQRYQEWKYSVFKSSGGFWELRGELMASLKSFKSGKGWFGGVPAGVYDSGNVSWFGQGDKGRKVLIAQYANWMEYGRRGQPPRPLFGPTLIEYSAGKAKTTAATSQHQIGKGWR
jgi:hypothetical protein